MQKVRETTILKCLGQENNQNFARLKITTKLGTESLVLGLKELMDKKLVKKDPETKIYTLQSETKNKTLELLKKNHVYGDDPEILEKLRDESFPFETGYTFLQNAMFTLSKLTLAQNSPDLTSFEKLEFKKQIQYHNSAIEKAFEVLYDIDDKQTLALKKLLDTTLTKPDSVFKLSGLANRKQRRRAKRF